MVNNKLDGVLNFFPDRDRGHVFWAVLIAVSTIIPIFISVWCLYNGVHGLYPLLLFLPIILVSYQYPHNGVKFALLLGAFHVISVLWFYPDILSFCDFEISSSTVIAGTSTPGICAERDMLFFCSAMAYSLLFVLISAIVSALSQGLMRQKQRYQTTFHSSEAGVIVLDLDTMTINEANDRAATILGFNLENLIGMHLDRFWPGFDGDRLKSEIRDKGTINSFEAQFLAKLHRKIWVYVSDAHLPGEGMALMLYDITKEKEQEKALQESQREIATLMSNIPGMAYRCEQNENERYISFVSDGAILLTGYLPSELTGKSVDVYLSLVHPEDRDRYIAEFRAAINENRHYHQIYRISTADGDERWLWEQGRGVLPVNGRFTCIEGFVTDVTDEVRSKEEIKRHNKQLSTINRIISLSNTLSSPDELAGACLAQVCSQMSMDAGAIYLVNEWDKCAELKNSVGDIKSDLPESLDITEVRYNGIYRDAIPQYEEKITDENTGDICSLATIPLVVGEKVIGSITMSVTGNSTFSADERNNIETIGTEIANAIHKAQLRQQIAEAYDEANLYLDIMSHDINNTNTISLGYLEVLNDMVDSKHREMVEIALGSVKKSASIIENVTTIRKINRKNSELQGVLLDNIINEEIQLFNSSNISFEQSGIVVMANDLISEVFTNLIGNSIKYGGPDVHIMIGVEDLGELVSVTIADNGPGIPDELKPVIFSRFQRGKTNTSGKGLGLFITKMLIDWYGGTIVVEDRVPGCMSKGARIRFTLKKYIQ